MVYGSANSVSPSRSTTLTQGAGGVPGTAEAGDAFGARVTTGDLDGDGSSDLAASAAGEDVTARATADGAAWVLRGSAPGLTTKAATSFSAPKLGLPYRDAAFASVLNH